MFDEHGFCCFLPQSGLRSLALAKGMKSRRRDVHFPRLTILMKSRRPSYHYYGQESSPVQIHLGCRMGQFLAILEDKAARAGHQVIRVNPRCTTQACSNCGELMQKSLSVRTHRCTFCGFIADRDVNAAKNLSTGSLWTRDIASDFWHKS